MRATRAKAILAAAIAAALVIGVPTAASAAVTKSGTILCAGLGKSTAYSTGGTEHYPPKAGYAYFYNGLIWRTTSKLSTSTGGGFWMVETDGSLSNSGTYGSCSNLS